MLKMPYVDNEATADTTTTVEKENTASTVLNAATEEKVGVQETTGGATDVAKEDAADNEEEGEEGDKVEG